MRVIGSLYSRSSRSEFGAASWCSADSAAVRPEACLPACLRVLRACKRGGGLSTPLPVLSRSALARRERAGGAELERMWLEAAQRVLRGRPRGARIMEAGHQQQTSTRQTAQTSPRQAGLAVAAGESPSTYYNPTPVPVSILLSFPWLLLSWGQIGMVGSGRYVPT